MWDPSIELSQRNGQPNSGLSELLLARDKDCITLQSFDIYPGADVALKRIIDMAIHSIPGP